MIFFRLARKFFDDAKILAYVSTFMYCLNPWFVRWGFTGMETSLAVFLVTGIFYLYFTERLRLMFFTLGLFTLVRPEAFLLLLIITVLVLYMKLKRNEFKVKEFVIWIMLSACLVIPFLVYAWLTFGTLVPNTVSGKSGSAFSFKVFYTQLYEIFRTLAGSSLPELLLSFSLIVYFVFKKTIVEKTIPLLLWISGLILVYVITDADIISRYLLIISPFLILLGLEFVHRFSAKNKSVLIITVAISSLLYSQFVFYKFVKPGTDNFTKGVNDCLKPLSIWIKENTPEGSRIFLNDVGVVGYFSERYIIDAAALINSDLMLNKKIMGFSLETRAHPFKMLGDIQADYIVERDTSELNNLHEYGKHRFELRFVRKFPSLGIRDSTPRYFKLYEVIKKD